MNILVVNSGSSSIKCKIFRKLPKNKINLLLEAQVSNLNDNHKAQLIIKESVKGNLKTYTLKLEPADVYGSAISQIFHNPIVVNGKIYLHTIGRFTTDLVVVE